MMPDYEDLKSLAVERMTESMRFVISLARDRNVDHGFVLWARGRFVARPRRPSSIASSKRSLRNRQDAHLARVVKRHWHYS